MSAHPVTSPLISVPEYLAGEEVAQVKHEYVAGQVFAMTGSSVQHNRICGNLFVALRAALTGTPCEVFIANIKVHCHLGRNDLFYYPDVMVCCDPTDQATHFRERPCLLVEVLSDSTRNHDLREKLMAYTRIDALQAYLILEQDRPEAILYRRANDWEAEHFSRREERLPLPCGDPVEVALAEIYPE